MTNSGGSWSQRQGLHFRRLCARPGCGTPATATLRFQPTLRQAWLVDLDESTARTQGDLCSRHAAALVLPRGWELHDQRTGRPRLVDEPAAATARAATPRRVRVRRRPPAKDTERAPSPLPGFEPVVVTNGDTPVASEAEVHELRDRSVAAPGPVGEAPAEPQAEATAGGPRPVPAQFGANDSDDAAVDDEALSSILDARTPLLRRAFRNAQPDA